MNCCKQPGCQLAAWCQRLCYTHWRQNQGWAFDAERKLFVRLKPKIANREGAA